MNTTSIILKGRKLVVDGQKRPLKQFLNIQNRIKELKLEKRNLAITKLFIKEVSTGIYGKILVSLERSKQA